MLCGIITSPLTNHTGADRSKTSRFQYVICAANLKRIAFAGIGNTKSVGKCSERKIDVCIFIGMPVCQEKRDVKAIGIPVFQILV